MTFSTRVTETLENLSIPYRLFIHEHLPTSLEEAADERGQVPGQIIRSILFRQGKNQFLMVLTAGTGQISWKKLRKHLGKSRISLATDEEVLAITGYPIGAVSPIGLKDPLRIIINRNVFDYEDVSIGSGKLGLAVILRTSNIEQVLGKKEVEDLSE